ncbi:unnamed protein product [Ambrosiozyma monospora]|uniref:Unnamed protein product n=1 Tax=Ambrosiozyma monospora TaxID=43982 RepID=A0A9W7DIJ7_AMBMO|nr:unnamed protein product [Ambrosiozyma monospora]
MCSPAICQLCMKKSWTESGSQSIEDVMNSTRREFWCTCKHNFGGEGEDVRFPPMAGTGTMRSYSVCADLPGKTFPLRKGSISYVNSSDSDDDNSIRREIRGIAAIHEHDENAIAESVPLSAGADNSMNVAIVPEPQAFKSFSFNNELHA